MAGADRPDTKPNIIRRTQRDKTRRVPYPRISHNSNGTGAFDGALDEGIGASGMRDPLQNFDGIAKEQLGDKGVYTPSDAVGDVGPNHYVQMVNRAFAIYSKTGREITAPVQINDLFAEDENCGDGNGDPIVLYDQFEDRWLLSQFTKQCESGPMAPVCYNCIAISVGGNPTGRYYMYKVAAQPDPLGEQGSVVPDYPKYGIWADSFVLTTRDLGGELLGVSVYAIEKEPMLSGNATRISQVCLRNM